MCVRVCVCVCVCVCVPPMLVWLQVYLHLYTVYLHTLASHTFLTTVHEASIWSGIELPPQFITYMYVLYTTSCSTCVHIVLVFERCLPLSPGPALTALTHPLKMTLVWGRRFYCMVPTMTTLRSTSRDLLWAAPVRLHRQWLTWQQPIRRPSLRWPRPSNSRDPPARSVHIVLTTGLSYHVDR